MIYEVIRIDEDVDFGCEERPEGSPVMAVVTLRAQDGTEWKLRVADQFLYDHDINEGNQVVLDESGNLRKG